MSAHERIDTFSTALKRIAAENETASTNVLTTLESFEDLRPLLREGSTKFRDIHRDLQKCVLILSSKIEKLSQLELQENATISPLTLRSHFRALKTLAEFLPTSFLDKIKPFSETDQICLVVEVDEDQIEPVGALLIETSAIDPSNEDSLTLIEILSERLQTTTIQNLLIYFVEDLRNRSLPLWKRFHISQSKDAEIEISPPSKEQRLLEAIKWKGIFRWLNGTIPDSVLDRWLPCALFIVDDANSDIACIGLEILQCNFKSASLEGLKKWKEVLTTTLLDRLLASDETLWEKIVPVSVIWLERMEDVDVCVQFFEKMLERLQTDVSPFVLGTVFARSAQNCVRMLGIKSVRFFSKLFPLLVKWLFSKRSTLQLDALNLLETIIDVTQLRIQRHRPILEELLSSLKSSDKELENKISSAKRQLDNLKGIDRNEGV